MGQVEVIYQVYKASARSLLRNSPPVVALDFVPLHKPAFLRLSSGHPHYEDDQPHVPVLSCDTPPSWLPFRFLVGILVLVHLLPAFPACFTSKFKALSV